MGVYKAIKRVICVDMSLNYGKDGVNSFCINIREDGRNYRQGKLLNMRNNISICRLVFHLCLNIIMNL